MLRFGVDEFAGAKAVSGEEAFSGISATCSSRLDVSSSTALLLPFGLPFTPLLLASRVVPS